MQQEDEDLVRHVEVFAVGGDQQGLLQKERHNRIEHNWFELSTLLHTVFIDRINKLQRIYLELEGMGSPIPPSWLMAVWGICSKNAGPSSWSVLAKTDHDDGPGYFGGRSSRTTGILRV